MYTNNLYITNIVVFLAAFSIRVSLLSSITFFLNRSVNEIMWKNMVQPDKP